MTATEITKIDNKVKAFVSRAIFELFSDPDFGLELSAKAKKILSMSPKTRKKISLNEIKKKYL